MSVPASPPLTEKIEIKEENIEWITLSGLFNGSQIRPIDGRAKWFEDELFQRWVKVRIDAGDTGIRTIVFRADLVEEVAYVPRAPS